MRTSEHFNLNLVEGTDLVNPLTQDVPNYEAIDAAMFANQSASIGTATELKTGTIHALTRANANTHVFRFTASSRFASGDTMTVDGVSVTVTAPNGTALVDGAYIVGSTVLCSLVGQLLTIYTVANAPDAEKLQGHDADYFATAEGLTQVNELATGTAELLTSVKSVVDNINDVFLSGTQSFPDITDPNLAGIGSAIFDLTKGASHSYRFLCTINGAYYYATGFASNTNTIGLLMHLTRYTSDMYMYYADAQGERVKKVQFSA